MKNILIIGATSEIAKACARIWAKDKSSFYLVGRNPEALSQIKSDLEILGAQSVYTQAIDLNELQAHQDVINAAWESLSKIDIAITAHGVLGTQNKAETDFSEMANIIQSNYVSHVSILTAVAEKFKKQKSGTIAVISSVAGDRGKQSNYLYGSAHAGKIAFTDGLRNRLFPHGVHVVTLKLGFIDTPMTAEFKKGPLWISSQSAAKKIVRAIKTQKNSAYIPGIWSCIMFVIKNIPETIFKRLKL